MKNFKAISFAFVWIVLLIIGFETFYKQTPHRQVAVTVPGKSSVTMGT